MKFEKATQDEMASAKVPKPKWPFALMEIGDACEVKRGQYGKTNPQIRVHVYASQSGRKFMTRKVSEDVWRIWRIA